MIGEIGGHADEDAVEWLSKNNIHKKPVLGFIAGKLLVVFWLKYN